MFFFTPSPSHALTCGTRLSDHLQPLPPSSASVSELAERKDRTPTLPIANLLFLFLLRPPHPALSSPSPARPSPTLVSRAHPRGLVMELQPENAATGTTLAVAKPQVKSTRDEFASRLTADHHNKEPPRRRFRLVKSSKASPETRKKLLSTAKQQERHRLKRWVRGRQPTAAAQHKRCHRTRPVGLLLGSFVSPPLRGLPARPVRGDATTHRSWPAANSAKRRQPCEHQLWGQRRPAHDELRPQEKEKQPKVEDKLKLGSHTPVKGKRRKDG
jgi:hypothetical protein